MDQYVTITRESTKNMHVSDNEIQNVFNCQLIPNDKKKTSIVWKATYIDTKAKCEKKLYYVVLHDDKQKIFCSLCHGDFDKIKVSKDLFDNKGFTYHTTTSILNFHLRSKHQDIYKNLIGGNKEGPIQKISKKTKHDLSKELLLKWIVSKSRPLSICDDEEFRDFVHSLDKEMKMPSSSVMKSLLVEKYTYYQCNLKEYFKTIRTVSFTCDGLTTNNHLHLFGITAHWCDKSVNQEHCHILLALKPMSIDISGNGYFELFKSVLDEYGLWSKLFCITTDNGGGNSTFIDRVDEYSAANGYKFKKSIHWNRCGAHIINLITQKFLECIKREVDIVRRFGQYIRNSAINIEKFHLVCEEMNVKFLMPVTDVPTRWNSTYEMLDRHLRYESVMHAFASNESYEYYSLSPADIITLKHANNVLYCFKLTSQCISASNYSTIHLLLPGLLRCRKFLNKLSTELSYESPLQNGIFNAIQHIDKYFGKESIMIIGSVLLNPGDKGYSFNMLDTINTIDKLSFRDEAIKTIKYYCEVYYNSKEKTDLTIRIPIKNQTNNLDGVHNNQHADLCSLSESQNPSFESSNECFNDLRKICGLDKQEVKKSPLDSYFDSPVEILQNQSIISWWKSKEQVYPALSLLAEDIFMTPGSSVPSEQAFSQVNLTLTRLRSRLDAKRVNALEVTKSIERCEAFQMYLSKNKTK